MKKLGVLFGLVAGSAWGQITWTKAWTGPISGATGTFFNGYHDIHYDPFTSRTWILSTDTTAGPDSIYSSRLHYFNSSAGTDTLVGTSNQPASGGCLSSSSTWPYTHHPVGQIWIDSIRHRLWMMEGVGCTFIYPEQWYYQLDSPISGHTNWVQVHPPHLPTKLYPAGPQGVVAPTVGGLFNNASVVHDTDHDAFFLFGYDGGNNAHSTQVYCDTSQNPSPGTLTAAQQSVGCTNADDWTDITSQTKCAAGSTCITAGGVGWTPPGYYYPNLEYDSIHHQVIQFAGLYGAYTIENQTWIYNMVSKTWTNMSPANPPANSSANNENGRVGHAFNTNDGKYYYHLTSHTPQSGSPLPQPPEDWVYDPVANTWTQLSIGQGPQLLESITYDSEANALIAWALQVESDGIYEANGIAETWVGKFEAATLTAPAIVSTSPLTPGTQSSAYSLALAATGSAPMTWSTTSGALPPGLSLSSSGVLSGTPTSIGAYAFAVQVLNSAGTAGPQSFGLTIASQAASPPRITSTSPLSQGTQNAAYSCALFATGSGPITWNLTSGALPAGLSLSSTGVVSGTPTASGSYTFSVQASNSAGASGSQGFTLTIAPPSGPSGLSVPITIQEALYPGSVAGVSRTNEPFCQGVPLPDPAAITGTNAFGLIGASAAQFRMLGRWPSGNYKWAEICGIVPNLTGGGTTSVTLTNTGSGNFGGPNLATDNGTTITVATGAATFTIKKANFNGVDQVVVGSTTVVASGSSQGLVVTGPNPRAAYPANVTCGSGPGQSACTTVYSSANDPNSTCAIEKNGPVEAVVKCTGDHVDSAGNIYMHFTVREYFYNGRTNMKITSELRNADYGTSGSFATAYKGHQGYELRIVPNISGTLNYTIANDTATPTTGAMSGNDSVYLYQGESQLMKWQDWCGLGCVPYTTDTGYSIVKNGSTLISGTDTQYPQGWADISNSNGVGIEIGVYQLSAYWPKSLEFNSGGTDVRIGIWARENSQPYYQSWPQQSTHDLYLNFHTAAPASPANEFLKFQHYLVARAAYTYYNSTSVFPYALIDPTVEDNYYTTAGSTAVPAISASWACCIQDFGISNSQWPLSIFRYNYWHDGGGGNQTEFRWSYLLNFITRGMTGRYLQAAHFYRFLADSAWPRADGFAWRNQPHANTSNPQVDGLGFPTATSANSSLAMGSANWIDQEHGHWYGLPDYYMMTGDETIHDGLLDGPKDWFLNPDTYQNGSFGGLWNSRAVGVELMGASRFSTFLTSTGDSDAPAVLTQGANDYLAQVDSQLCVSGFPAGCSFGPIQPSGSWTTQGVSRTRGIHYGGTSSYLNPWCGIDSTHVRGAATFMATNLIQGILELHNAEGPNWSEYVNSLDLAYGISRWALSEMFVDDGSGNWEVNGFRYYVALDLSATCGGTQDPHTVPQAQQTVWFSFLPKYLVDGDTSWAGKFKIGIQRDEAAIGTTTSDFGAYSPAHMMTILNNPTSTVLNNVPITSAVDNGGNFYTISWTVPSGAQSYRIKWGPLQIVDWIGFDSINNVFTGDPVHTMAWFAATNATNIPAPLAAGTTQSLTISTGIANLTAANFSVKAYVANGPPPTTDTTPPTVSMTAPANGAIVAGSVAVSANATDNVGVASIQFQLDGASLGTPQTGAGPSYSVPWATTAALNGLHTLSAIASDAAGNTATSSVSVTVSNAVAALVISAVGAGSITSSSATIGWTTSTAASSQVAYGLTSAYGSLTALVPALATAHSVNLSGLAASTTYHYQVMSQDAQGNLVTSGDFTFSTVATIGPLLQLHLDTTEVSGITSGSIVTPSTGPAGFMGTVVANGAGSVNFTPAQVGNGVYFLNCCENTNNAYYKFTGAAIGNIFNVSEGQVSFYLQSRYTFAQRQASATSPRYAFDVRDANRHLFYFLTEVSSGRLIFSYTLGDGAQFYYVAQGTEDTLFGNGVILQVTIAWNGSVGQLYFNNALVQSFSYTAPTPNWTAASNFDLGAYEYVTFGGYDVADDVIDEFTVSGPTPTADTIPPTVSMTAPANGATVTGSVVVSANATDNVVVASVQFQLDGASLGSPQTGAGPSYSVPWATTAALNGLHTLSAIASDAAGNTATSSVSVTVSNAVAALVISAVGAGSITSSSATIAWTTSTAASSQVAYGLTSAYGSLTALVPALTTAHSVNLSGLAASTTYHYQVMSQDAQGSPVTSGDFTFATMILPQVAFTFTSFDPPESLETQAIAVNDEGSVVGYYLDSNGLHVGYKRFKSGAFSKPIQIPGGNFYAVGLNDYGVISGYYYLPMGTETSFTLAKRVLTQFAYNGFQTQVGRINNNGDLTGIYMENSSLYPAFVYVAATKTTTSFSVPGAAATFGEGLNNNDMVVGDYTTIPYSTFQSFIRVSSGKIYTFHFPNATQTYAEGINDCNIIVGSFYDTANMEHGSMARSMTSRSWITLAPSKRLWTVSTIAAHWWEVTTIVAVSGTASSRPRQCRPARFEEDLGALKPHA